MIDQLGWEQETRGHLVHEFVAFMQQFWLFNYINNAVNLKRKKAIMELKALLRSIYGNETLITKVLKEVCTDGLN